jgi:hypothetical protein
MRSIIINTSFGEFSLSHKAFLRLRELGQAEALQEVDQGAYWPKGASPKDPTLNQCGKLVPREDAKLVQTVQELGAEANGHAASLKIVRIPLDVPWEIEKVNGVEQVSEKRRTWK